MRRTGGKSSEASKVSKKKNAENRVAKLSGASSARFAEHIVEPSSGPAPTIFKGGLASFRLSADSPAGGIDSGLSDNPEYNRCVRLLGKRDPITRVKALASIQELFQSGDIDMVKELTPLWAKRFNRLTLDNSRLVRQAAHETMDALISVIGKFISPVLPVIAGPWLCSLHDPANSVSIAANASFATAFPDTSKQETARQYLLPHFLSYSSSTLKMSVKDFSEPHDSKDEVEERYNRVISCCIMAASSFPASSVLELRQTILQFLKLGRVPIYRSVLEFITKHCTNWEDPGEGYSILYSSNQISRRYMWPALIALSSRFPNHWSPEHIDQLLQLINSPEADQHTYTSCVPILKSWKESTSIAPAFTYYQRLLTAIWSAADRFTLGQKIADSLLDAYSSCFRLIYSYCLSGAIRTELLQQFVVNRISEAFSRLQSAVDRGPIELIFPRAKVIASTFVVLGGIFRLDLPAEWDKSSLVAICEQALSSGGAMCHSVYELVAAANQPGLADQVFAMAVSRWEVPYITLSDMLLDDIKLSQEMESFIFQSFKTAVSSATVPPVYFKFVCRAIPSYNSQLFECVSAHSSNTVLIQLVVYIAIEATESFLFQKLSAAVLARFFAPSTLINDIDQFHNAFSILLSYPSQEDHVIRQLLDHLVVLSKMVQDNTAQSRFIADPSAFELLCAQACVAILALCETGMRSEILSDCYFWLGCLLFSVHNYDEDVDSESIYETVSPYIAHLSTLAQEKWSSLSVRPCGNICDSLLQQIVHCRVSDFDHTLWANFVHSVPTDAINECFPSYSTLLSLVNPDTAVVIRDALIETVEMLEDVSCVSAHLLPSLGMMESHLFLDRRAQRLFSRYVLDRTFSSDVLTEMFAIAWSIADEFPDRYSFQDYLRTLCLTIVKPYPDLIVEQFSIVPVCTIKSALIPAIHSLGTELAVELLERSCTCWTEMCMEGASDVEGAAKCLSVAILVGVDIPRDAVWSCAALLSTKPEMWRSWSQVTSAAILTFPVFESSNEIVDCITWIVDTLQEQGDDFERVNAALSLLSAVVNTCVSTPAHIHDAIDHCLPLLSPSSLNDIASVPSMVSNLGQIISHFDVMVLPDDARHLLMNNLLQEMLSPNAEMALLGYRLMSRIIVCEAKANRVELNPPPGSNDIKAIAESFYPSFLFEVIASSPDIDASPAFVRRYMLVWLTYIDMFSIINAEIKDTVLSFIRDMMPANCMSSFFEEVLEHILGSPPTTPTLCLESNIPSPTIRAATYLRRVRRSPHSCRLFSSLASLVYYRALSAFPVLSRVWWASCERSAAEAYRKVTAKRFTALLIEDEVSALKSAALDDGFSIRCSKSGEITASLKHAEIALRLVIRLPSEHPLRAAEVDLSDTKGVDIKRSKWWTLNISMILSSRNGSVRDAVWLWKKNVDAHFDGIEDCPICFSIIHAVTDQIPRLSCRVCKHKFHAACLYKWFSSSSGSSCPLCRSVF